MKLYEKILVGSAGAAGAGAVAWKTMFPWIGYDIKLMKIGFKIGKTRNEALNSFIIDKFEAHVVSHPKKPFIIFEDSVYSYEFVDQMACKVANVARSLGLKLNDTVAMVISNEPSFVWTFLGLQKLGITVALINYNLKMAPLIHSIQAVNPKIVIVGEGDMLLKNIVDVQDQLTGMAIYVQGLGSTAPPQGLHSFDPLLLAAYSSAIDHRVRKDMTMLDICCYIYTSGTTGNPKPAFIQQGKAIGLSCALAVVEFDASDTLYIPLPLYHSAGGGIGFMAVLREGATMVLKRKFSASQFWADCSKYDVTVIQYIGELFRYLLATPPNEFETNHKVRAAFGNGLRKDIWKEVDERFNIPSICEFFGATEGVTMLVNNANRPGAIGRLSPFMNRLDPDPKELVKFDYLTAQPIRDKNGRCIKVQIGEPGLFISKVPDAMLVNKDLEVYKSSKEANEKKLVRNAFVDGDIYFNYGDVFVLDSDYFLYFQDRIGDTFRWKGENVSTTELANVITSLDFIQDANVYGVKIPGHDGRAGMVALTLHDGYKLGEKELKELFDLVKEELPVYSQPLFVRQLDQAILTGTFKQRKVELMQESYDLNKVKDALYFRDTTKKTYSVLTKADLPKFLNSKL